MARVNRSKRVFYTAAQERSILSRLNSAHNSHRRGSVSKTTQSLATSMHRSPAAITVKFNRLAGNWYR